MNGQFKKWGTILGMSVSGLVLMGMLWQGNLWALENQFDKRYLLVAESLEGKLLDLQDEIFEWEQQQKWEGNLTQRQLERLDRLLLREEQLMKKLGYE